MAGDDSRTDQYFFNFGVILQPHDEIVLRLTLG